MSLPRRLLAFYARIGRTYIAWAPVLLALALIVFLPLGLIDAINVHADLEDFSLDNGVKIFVLALAVSVLTATSLLGEVFYSGAIAISLTHPSEERPPTLREIAGQIAYRRLIVVDILYVAIVVVGMVLFVVPGVLAFVFLGLAGPIIEIEKQTVRGALARSFHLVRRNFWFVFLILVPIEIAGDALGEGLAGLVHALFGHSFVASWLAESAADIALSPIFAVAAVLLTIDLAARRRREADGDAPAPMATHALPS